jgi:hypothetical protein
MKKFLLISLIVAAIGTLIVLKITFRKADTSVESKKVDVVITANDLLNAFESDETTANAKYLNKIILVEGIIAEIKADSTSVSVYLKEPEAISGVLCGFNSETEISDKINIGQKIKIKGMCTGYLMDVVLNKCAFE